MYYYSGQGGQEF